MLAAGRCDAIIAGPCYIWDLAAALPFTRSAGHVERYLDGSAFSVEPLLQPPYAFPVHQPLLVGSPAVVDSLLGILR
jgi:fructose-1,6-bisphosphatase/inositol monophosphatase family enzyme